MTRRDSTPPTADDGTDWREIADGLAMALNYEATAPNGLYAAYSPVARAALRRYEEACRR